MDFIRYKTSKDFFAAVEPFLLQEEKNNNLILSLLRQMKLSSDKQSVESTLMVAVKKGKEVILAAVKSAADYLVFSVGDAEGAEEMARALTKEKEPLKGIFAPEAISGLFVEIWKRGNSIVPNLTLQLRVYFLEQVNKEAIRGGVGRLRPATKVELKTVTAWALGYAKEAGTGDDPVHLERFVHFLVKNKALFVWDDGGLCSMAGVTRSTPNGAAISLVFTPPEYRCRGLAKSCVGALSQKILDAGKTFSCLFANIENPRSCRAYERVGYQRGVIFHEYVFAQEGERTDSACCPLSSVESA